MSVQQQLELIRNNKIKFLDILGRIDDCYNGRHPSDAMLEEYFKALQGFKLSYLEKSERELKRLNAFPKLYQVEQAMLHYRQSDVEQKPSAEVDFLEVCEKSGNFANRICAKYIRLRLSGKLQEKQMSNIIDVSFALQKKIAEKKIREDEATKVIEAMMKGGE